MEAKTKEEARKKKEEEMKEAARLKEEEARLKEEAKKKREEELRKKREEEEALKQKKREEKERLAQERAERERKLAEEKAERERKRIEQQNARNEEKKRREEEKEKEKKQREEERLKREEEKRQKEEEKEKEKRLREEERLKKEEERLKKEEEKKQKEAEKLKEDEEKKRKEEKVKSHFVNYFIKKETTNSNEKDESHKGLRFMPFQPKENMIIAPICRRNDIIQMSNEDHEAFLKNIDESILNQGENPSSKSNYLTEIRQNPKLIRRQKTTCRRKNLVADGKFANENSNDIVELEAVNQRNKYKIKFLMFDPKEYRRPPYYGTWRKKSKFIGPRNPFAKDEDVFNYEVDSDDEWEDEPEDAESVNNSGDEEEEEPEDEEDDGFFVPHGHLSDEELDEDDRLVDPETRKAREKVRNDLYETERKSKSSKMIIPKCYFVPKYWDQAANSGIRLKEDEMKHLEKFRMVPLSVFPVNIQTDSNGKDEKSKSKSTNPNETTPMNKKKTKQAVALMQVKSSPASPNVTPSTTASTNCQPILKFISKKSKKDIICNIEAISSEPESCLLMKSVLKTPEPKSAEQQQRNTQTPSSLIAKPTPNSTPTISNATPETKHVGNLNLSEKRSLGSGNREGTVKRLKLDDSHRVTTNSPSSTPQPNILSLLKKATTKKESDQEVVEKMDITESGSTDNKENNEMTKDVIVLE